MVVLMLHHHKTQYKPSKYIRVTASTFGPTEKAALQCDNTYMQMMVLKYVSGRDEVWLAVSETHDIVHLDESFFEEVPSGKMREEGLLTGWRHEGKWWKQGRGEETAKEKQGTGLTYMRWEGLQVGDSLLWVGIFPFREIGLQARAGLIHRHGPTGPRWLPAFQGWGAGGVGVVWTAGDLIDIGCDLPPERGVLALQRVQLEETVSNKLRRALSKASFVPRSGTFSSIPGKRGSNKNQLHRKTWIIHPPISSESNKTNTPAGLLFLCSYIQSLYAYIENKSHQWIKVSSGSVWQSLLFVP